MRSAASRMSVRVAAERRPSFRSARETVLAEHPQASAISFNVTRFDFISFPHTWEKIPDQAVIGLAVFNIITQIAKKATRRPWDAFGKYVQTKEKKCKISLDFLAD
jgi:DNA primase